MTLVRKLAALTLSSTRAQRASRRFADPHSVSRTGEKANLSCPGDHPPLKFVRRTRAGADSDHRDFDRTGNVASSTAERTREQ